MASKIRVLSDQTINKIAAGEVIENPASVVKELVENSLDAGAKNISVEIQEGGRQLIRITDDGCGMTQDDALLSLERHATSKIREVEDIENIPTLGFRGEAVPSIAAISKLTLLTCPQNTDGKEEKGTLISVEGGRILSCSSSYRSPGTTIEVKTLFFNVPVRRKFQKSPAYDAQEILKMLGLLALAHPGVQFELIADCKTLLKTPLTPQNLSFQEQLGRRLECVLGKEFAAGVLALNFRQGPYELTGYIGSAQSHKPNKTGQHLFINQRSVFSPLIGGAVREGYGTMLPTQRYPIFVLHLAMSGSLLDVNVHPQKKEVRIRQETQLREAIIQAVQIALRQETVKVFGQDQSLQNCDEGPLPPPFWGSPQAAFFQRPASIRENWKYQASDSPVKNLALPSLEAPFSSSTPPSERTEESSSHPSPQEAAPEFPSLLPPPLKPKVLATLMGYCILEPFHLSGKLFGPSAGKREGGLALLDQRAAYSRIHYEKLLKGASDLEIQPLLIPLTLQLSTPEFEALALYAKELNRMGFSLREFGERTFLIDAYPFFLKEDQLQNCLSLLVQDLVQMQTSRHLQMKKEEQLAFAASRASIPSAKQLFPEEAQEMVHQLLLTDFPGLCPMGKPTCLYLAPEEIAKWFQK